MLPSTQHVAIDLSRGSLQAADSEINNTASAGPDGTFAALLSGAPAATGSTASTVAGSELPQTGSDLPMLDVPVPAEDVPMEPAPAEFVAFFDGEPELAPGPVTADPLLQETGADVADMVGLTGVAPPTLLSLNQQNGDPGRGNSRLQLQATGDGRFARRDHGRMALVQPMAPPDRMIFNAALPGGEQVSMPDASGVAGGRISAGAEPELAMPEQTLRGERIPGLPGTENNARAMGEMTTTMEIPVRKEGAEALPKTAATVQMVTNAGQLTDPGAERDLAGTAKPTPILTTTIDRPVMDDAWGEAFQDRVLWMAKGKIQNAEIRLNPAELGPIRVQVSVEDDAAMLQFTAQHSATREAIEQALPRLRDMLSENGLTLAESSVNDQAEGQQNDTDGEPATGSVADGDAPEAESADNVTLQSRAADSVSLVDTFA